MTDERPVPQGDESPPPSSPTLHSPVEKTDDDERFETGAAGDVQLLCHGLYSLDAAIASQAQILPRERLQLRAHVAVCHAALTALRARLGDVGEEQRVLGRPPRPGPIDSVAIEGGRETAAPRRPRSLASTLTERLTLRRLGGIGLIAAAVTVVVIGAVSALRSSGSEQSEAEPPACSSLPETVVPELAPSVQEAPVDVPPGAPTTAAPPPTADATTPVIPSELPREEWPFPFPAPNRPLPEPERQQPSP